MGYPVDFCRLIAAGNVHFETDRIGVSEVPSPWSGRCHAGVGGRSVISSVQSVRGDATRQRRWHDPGGLCRIFSVMLADGGDYLADPGALRDWVLFGPVASDRPLAAASSAISVTSSTAPSSPRKGHSPT
jgi:hypothetical protein